MKDVFLNNLRNDLKNKKKVMIISENDGGKAVVKEYEDKRAFETEIKVLRLMRHTGYSPDILDESENSVTLEYIEGELFSDVFLRLTMTDDAEGLEAAADRIGIFLQIFYSVCQGFLVCDADFSNFIIKDDRCYGYDYENVREGVGYSDVAGLIAYAVKYTAGEYSSCFPFVKRLLSNFHIDIMDVINEVREYLEVIASEVSVMPDSGEICELLVDMDPSDRKK